MVSKRKVYSNGVSRNGRLYNSKARTSQRYNHRDAEIIFKRLGMAVLRETLKVRIRESELHKLSYIYPRLYQVPEKVQRRLRTWIHKNRGLTQDWEFGNFLKTKRADRLEATKPREPGYPR